MRQYFYNTILQCFDNAVYTVFGSVAVALYGDGKDEVIRYVVYDIANNELMKLSDEKQKNHVKFEKIYKISDVNFNEKFSVLQKINELVKSFEIEIYNMQ